MTPSVRQKFDIRSRIASADHKKSACKRESDEPFVSQLQAWVEETSDKNLTLTERLEKSTWTYRVIETLQEDLGIED